MCDRFLRVNALMSRYICIKLHLRNLKFGNILESRDIIKAKSVCTIVKCHCHCLHAFYWNDKCLTSIPHPARRYPIPSAYSTTVLHPSVQGFFFHEFLNVKCKRFSPVPDFFPPRLLPCWKLSTQICKQELYWFLLISWNILETTWTWILWYCCTSSGDDEVSI